MTEIGALAIVRALDAEVAPYRARLDAPVGEVLPQQGGVAEEVLHQDASEPSVNDVAADRRDPSLAASRDDGAGTAGRIEHRPLKPFDIEQRVH